MLYFIVVLQRKTNKCTKMYNAPAEPLFRDFVSVSVMTNAKRYLSTPERGQNRRMHRNCPAIRSESADISFTRH